MLRSIRWMRAQNFDWVIDLQCLARSGAFAWLANGKFLIGLDEVREGARGFYDVAVRRASFHTHAVDWYLAVLPRLGVPVHKNFHMAARTPGNRRRSETQMARRIVNPQSAIRNPRLIPPARRPLGKQTLAGGKFCRTRPPARKKISRRALRHSRRPPKTNRSAKSFRAPRRNAA